MASPFDPGKEFINVRKHKLSLEFGDRIFGDREHLILPSIRPEDGEDRFKVIGMVSGRVFTGVFTWRDGLPRFISVRRSNKHEE